jgi:uroporphyrinogen-III synthase
MKILITRPRSQADRFAENIRTAGLEPIYFPVIEIRPIQENVALQRALSKLDCYDWLVFTSVNGVNAVWDTLSNMQMESIPENVQVAAIGPKTAEALQAHGISPAFVPDEYVAEAILPGLGDLNGRWVLLPRAEIARKTLPQGIVEAGGVAHEIAVYQTLPAEPDPQGLLALRAGLDVVTLTSPSTVLNFVEIVRAAGLDPLNLPGNPVFACIGPITGQAARAEGLPNLVVAGEYTTEGLIQAIQALKTR